jgi:hypothetical protein
MKSHQAINKALSDWKVVRDAPSLARDLFDDLDDGERDRLALRALTDEVRSTLRRKDSSGVPVYGNVEKVDTATGTTVRQYKQVSAFDVADYGAAIRSARRRAAAENRTVAALRADCAARLGVQLTLDGREVGAA